MGQLLTSKVPLVLLKFGPCPATEGSSRADLTSVWMMQKPQQTPHHVRRKTRVWHVSHELPCTQPAKTANQNQIENVLSFHKAKKKKMLCCPHPTDHKMRKNRVGFFCLLFCWKCQIWAKNLLKFIFNGLKKHLYMRFDCIPPEFSPFRNFKKIIGKLNSLTVRKKYFFFLIDRPTQFSNFGRVRAT